MSAFFTSDPHIGHKLVATHRWERAFPGIQDPDPDTMVSWHDQVLAQNWDSVVSDEDQVWVLGDISSGSARAQKAALEWFRARPGLVHLITGNHDGPHPMHRDSHRWQKIYLEVFESVQMAARRRIPLPDEGHTQVFLSHFPYKADRGTTPRHLEWRLVNAGEVLLHGHTHSTRVISHDTNVWDPHLARTPQIHVGADAWGMKLVSDDVLHDLVWQVINPESDIV